MAKSNQRGEPRLQQARRAKLTAGGETSACLIQDVSTRGFLIMATKQFNVGDVMELKSEFQAGQIFECKIQVRHTTSDGCLGTQIVEINDASARLCQQFIEEHYADRLKFG